MSAKKKGFSRPQKAPTKGQMVQQQGEQIEQNKQMINKLQMMLFQTSQQFSQHLSQIQSEVGEMATLFRMQTVSTGAEENDRVMLDLLTRQYNEDGSLQEGYVPALTLVGFKVDVIVDEKVHYFLPLVKEVLGKKAGDVFQVDVVVPEHYGDKELVGKKLQMDVSVLNVFRDCGEANNRIVEMKAEIDAAKALKAKEEAEKKQAEAEAAKAEEAPAENK